MEPTFVRSRWPPEKNLPDIASSRPISRCGTTLSYLMKAPSTEACQVFFFGGGFAFRLGLRLPGIRKVDQDKYNKEDGHLPTSEDSRKDSCLKIGTNLCLTHNLWWQIHIFANPRIGSCAQARNVETVHLQIYLRFASPPHLTCCRFR